MDVTATLKFEEWKIYTSIHTYKSMSHHHERQLPFSAPLFDNAISYLTHNSFSNSSSWKQPKCPFCYMLDSEYISLISCYMTNLLHPIFLPRKIQNLLGPHPELKFKLQSNFILLYNFAVVCDSLISTFL